MISLKNLLEKLNVQRVGNAAYYKLSDIINILNGVNPGEIQVEDCIITPFYIENKMVLELYWLELHIRLVNSPGKEIFILNKTGKKNIGEVDENVIENLTRCYLEAVYPSRVILSEKLLHYFLYIQNSSKIAQAVSCRFQRFLHENLYFEFY